MNPPVSAFEIYKTANQNKRKHTTESKLPSKKAKINYSRSFKVAKKNGNSTHGKKPKHTNNQNNHSGTKKEKGVVKKDVTSNDKNHSTKKALKKVFKEDLTSDDEIPTLVPIAVAKEDKDATKKSFEIKNNTKSKSSNDKSVTANDNDNSCASNHIGYNPVIQGLAIFKWLIDPISPKYFFEKYWEKDILHVQHLDTNYFKDIFSSNKLDRILREFPLYFTRNVDVVAYENGKKEVLNPEGRAVPSQLWDYYTNGCSIRVLNPQTYDQNVHSVISSLQEYFGTMVGTNVYLTPPGSQGFAPHFDDIEAFIVQLEGTKHWKLYKPSGADVLARDSSQNFNREDIGEPFMEVTLNAGDLLYFPRGTIHEGRTGDDAHSLHITVSVYQHTAYVDLLEQLLPQALKKAAAENIEYRRGLPLNYLKHVGIVNQNANSQRRQSIINKTKSLVESLVNYMDVDSAADHLGKKFMYDAMPPLYSLEESQYSSKCDGDFMKNGKVYNRVEIGLEVKVRLLRYYAVRVVKENENTSKLYYCTDNAKTYHGEDEQWLEIENSLIPAMEMLQKKYPEFVGVESLPVEDETAKLQLVSDLWERGLLVTDGPLPRGSYDSDTDSSAPSEEYELVESDSD